MDFSISPLKGVGTIQFGMSPDEVRACVNQGFKSFKRAPQDSFPADYFQDIGTFCYYDSDGKLEAMEFASPAQPSIKGAKLLDLSLVS